MMSRSDYYKNKSAGLINDGYLILQMNMANIPNGIDYQEYMEKTAEVLCNTTKNCVLAYADNRRIIMVLDGFEYNDAIESPGDLTSLMAAKSSVILNDILLTTVATEQVLLSCKGFNTSVKRPYDTVYYVIDEALQYSNKIGEVFYRVQVGPSDYEFKHKNFNGLTDEFYNNLISYFNYGAAQASGMSTL